MAVTSANGAAIAQSPNYIINGAFDFWQRSTSVAITADSTYFAPDRFKSVWAAGGGSGTWSQQTFPAGAAPVPGYEGTYFSRQTVTGGGSSTEVGFTQFIEDVRTLAGQTVTLSFWAKADSARTLSILVQQRFGAGGSTSVGTTVSQAITTSWNRYTYTFVLPSIAGKTIGAGSNVAPWIWLGPGQASGSVTLDVWGIQLEAGSIATPFRRNANSIQGELAACQRYYYQYGRKTDGNTLLARAQHYSTSANTIYHTIVHPVPMRIIPGLDVWVDVNDGTPFQANTIISSSEKQGWIAVPSVAAGAFLDVNYISANAEL